MDVSNFLIIGAHGQLGLALQSQYPAARAVDSAELDITDMAALRAFDWAGITTVLNAAAYTNVDGAETSQGRIAAWNVNALGVRNLAELAIENNLTLVHISSDYVFDGTYDTHTETESFSPLGVYGQSKAAGDIAASLPPKHYILRTTWVIGEGKNFVHTMLGLGQKGIAPTVVADQIGRLTFTSELVRTIDHLLSREVPFGTYNVTNGGEPASWAAITREIFKLGGFDLTVSDTSTADYFAGKEGIAPRPLQSTLDLHKLEHTGYAPRDWRIDLQDYITKELSA
jgi:dTDP-4-dehydrorhamnose reductase